MLLQLPGYSVIDTIHAGAVTQVVRARADSEGRMVAIKASATPSPSPSTIARLQHEAILLRQLDGVPGVVRLLDTLQTARHGSALLLELHDMPSLDRLLQGLPWLVSDVLRIAHQLAQTLAVIHSRDIVHKDIKPQNLIVSVSAEDCQTTLLDFGISSRLAQEATAVEPPEALEGTLAYISPEQTGRTGRTLDARSDLYSLGVLLFELLSGQRPFLETEPMKLVHAHLALPPPLLSGLNPRVPAAVCAVVEKLLAKDPEQRYQTAQGLATDLEECRKRLGPNNEVSRFALGTRDFSPRLRLPQGLVGRAAEIAQMSEAFVLAARGAAGLLLLGGPSGIGKTALVRTVYRDIAQVGRGTFVWGKHDQFARATPFAGVAQAFGQLMKLWLASPEPVLQAWRQRVRDSIGDNARLLADLIPELEWVMGPLKAVPDVGPNEMKTRLEFTWLRFMQGIIDASAPMVIFLDDMQWADAATFDLLKLLLTNIDRRSVLVIAAYRDNEVDAGHGLWPLVEAVQKHGTEVRSMTVVPLPGPHIEQWVRTVFAVPDSQARPLAALLQDKTRGNPFFMEQLVLDLHRKRRITRDLESGEWRWNLAQLAQAPISPNVVELMAEKISELPEETQRLLGWAACAGHSFSLQELGVLSGWKLARVTQALWPALTEGLLLPQNLQYRDAQALSSAQSGHSLDADYRFLHDRVQQAFYTRLTEDQRLRAHLDIGRRLQARHVQQSGSTAQELFEAVRHLNLAAHLITEEAERVELARLNLEAACTARRATLYDLMASLVNCGRALATSIGNHGTLKLDLELEHLQALYFAKQFTEMEILGNVLLKQEMPSLAWWQVQEIRIRACLTSGQYDTGVAIGRMAFECQGVQLPNEKEALQQALALARELDVMADHLQEILPQLIQITDPEYLIKENFSAQLMYCAASGSSPMLACLTVAQNLYDQLHNKIMRPAFLLWVGVFSQAWSALFQDYRRAAIWPVSAYKHLSVQQPFFEADLLFFTASYLQYQTSNIEKLKEIRTKGYLLALGAGNKLMVGVNLFAKFFYLEVWSNQKKAPLSELVNNYQIALKLIEQDGDQIGWNWISIAGYLINSLIDGNLRISSAEFRMKGDSQSAEIALIVECQYYIALGRIEEAFREAAKAEQNAAAIFGHLIVTDIPLWRALSAAKHIDTNMSGEQRAEHLCIIERALERFKYFSEGCKENFLCKQRLIEAEYAKVQGRVADAMAFYDEAIELADMHGFPQIEGLAWRYTAEFYLELGRKRVAEQYMTGARTAYMRYGADAVVKHLEQTYPALLMNSVAQAAPRPGTSTSTHTTANSATSFASGAQLDISTAVHGARVMMGELNPHHVLAKLMTLAVENAGAQRGVLLLQDEAQSWHIVARLSATEEQVRAGLHEPLESALNVAHTVVQYVLRSRDPLVLANAPEDPRFCEDPRLKTTATRSLLLTPLSLQGRLVGLLYLEQDSAFAFTPERVALLTMLAAQGAIAHQNARLYQELQRTSDALRHANEGLEAQVAERTAALDKALKELWAEMDLARKIQGVLLPPNQTFFERDEFAGLMRPADEVGGDYYDAFAAGDKLWVLIGDVSGHGVSAGLIMMMVQTAVRSLVQSFADARLELTPARLLTLVNRAVWSNLQLIGKGQYMTMTALCIQGHQVVYAGLHQSLLVFRNATEQVEELESSGVWLGVMDEIEGMNEDRSLDFAPGDTLLLYTDGLTEMQRSAEDRTLLELAPVVERYQKACRARVTSEAVTQSIFSLTTEGIIKDDVSVVALRHLKD